MAGTRGRGNKAVSTSRSANAAPLSSGDQPVPVTSGPRTRSTRSSTAQATSTSKASKRPPPEDVHPMPKPSKNRKKVSLVYLSLCILTALHRMQKLSITLLSLTLTAIRHLILPLSILILDRPTIPFRPRNNMSILIDCPFNRCRPPNLRQTGRTLSPGLHRTTFPLNPQRHRSLIHTPHHTHTISLNPEIPRLL